MILSLCNSGGTLFIDDWFRCFLITLQEKMSVNKYFFLALRIIWVLWFNIDLYSIKRRLYLENGLVEIWMFNLKLLKFSS